MAGGLAVALRPWLAGWLFHARYEPIGGSAPDIAGKGLANPIAQILSEWEQKSSLARL